MYLSLQTAYLQLAVSTLHQQRNVLLHLQNKKQKQQKNKNKNKTLGSSFVVAKLFSVKTIPPPSLFAPPSPSWQRQIFSAVEDRPVRGWVTSQVAFAVVVLPQVLLLQSERSLLRWKVDFVAAKSASCFSR